MTEYTDNADKERAVASLAVDAYMGFMIERDQLAAQIRLSPVLDFAAVAAECRRRQSEGDKWQDVSGFLRDLLESEESLEEYLSR
jgi:hypothetical protein